MLSSNHTSPILSQIKADSEHSGTDTDSYFEAQPEEYIQIKDSELSCHILPLSNAKFNSTNPDFKEDESY
jgi:hypothetical protein